MKMRFTPLLLCAFGLLALPGDAFRTKLRGKPVSQEIGLDPQDMPEPAVDDDEKSYLRRLLDYFWEPEEDAVAEAFVESVMSEEDRAQIRGEPLQKARRSLARGGGGRSSGSRSTGSYRSSGTYSGASRGTGTSGTSRGTSSTSSRGTSSTSSGSRGAASYANYSGYKGATSPSRANAASRTTTTYKTTTTKTTYTYTSSSSYSSSSSWGRSTYYGGYGFYGGFYYPPYYPSLFWYTAMRPSWSSSDYCYACNRMGGNGRVQSTMTQQDLAAIDGALDILYSKEWDGQQVCNNAGSGCVANPDHYKALILNRSEGFDKIKNFGQISSQWRTYTTPRTRTAVYRKAGCYSFKYQPTQQDSDTCGSETTEQGCDTFGTRDPDLECMWKNAGAAIQIQKNPPGRRRLSERRRMLENVQETVYDGATEANRYALINAIEYGREEVTDVNNGNGKNESGSMVGVIVGAVVGAILFCCAIFFLWWCCCRDDGSSDYYHDEHHHHSEVQTTTVVETTEVVETTGGGQPTAYVSQPQGTPSSITINGAGAWQVNGTYTRSGDQNGRPKYIKTDNQMMGIMFDDGSWWIGDVRPSTADFYRHESNPQDPPAYGWGVCVGGGPAQGVEPAPSLQFGYGNEGVEVYS